MNIKRLEKLTDTFKKRFEEADFLESFKTVKKLVDENIYLCIEVTENEKIIGWFIMRVDSVGNRRDLVIVHVLSNQTDRPISLLGVAVCENIANNLDVSHIRVHADFKKMISFMDSHKKYGYEEYERVYLKKVK